MRRAFTLAELLITIAIIAILAGLGFAAFNGATNLAREHRTQTQIKKIDSLLMERWESYRTRSVAFKVPPMWGPLDAAGRPTITDGKTIATVRLSAIRDLMRMECPDRITDLTDDPAILMAKKPPPYNQDPAVNIPPQLGPPALFKRYRREVTRKLGANWAAVWTEQYQGAECLYLILSSMGDGDKRALDYFDESEIGDTDGDGMKEVLDGWGNPIEFLRWAPGYVKTLTLSVDTMQNPNAQAAPDPFDPMQLDYRWQGLAQPIRPFLLHPLVFSAGPDKQYDIAVRLLSGPAFHYTQTMPMVDDPYFLPNNGQPSFGTPIDPDNDGPGWMDNLTNHAQL